MPRLQCNQGQQESTGTLRSRAHSESKSASELLRMEQKDWDRREEVINEVEPDPNPNRRLLMKSVP